MTRDERMARREALYESGSIFASEDMCGEGEHPLPCGLCDECEDQGVLDD